MPRNLKFLRHRSGTRTGSRETRARGHAAPDSTKGRQQGRRWHRRRSEGLTVDQPTVLIISDEVDFSRRVSARWQMERSVPTFTMLSGDLWPRFAVDSFDVAIVDELRRELLSV